ncbi:MAG TPA: SufD family Fe-S cluster assembly protein, partial [Gemmatimonadaceae bacterium]
MTAAVVDRVDATQPYAEAYRAWQEDDRAAVPAHAAALRAAGIERFAALGFPTTKNEDWHFTSVAPIAEHEYVFVPTRSGDVRAEALAPFLFEHADWPVMVFVNGRFARELSRLDALPDGVRIRDLPTAWREAPALAQKIGTIANLSDHAFTALNSAFLLDGAVLEIAADAQIAAPIHLLFVVDANAAKAMVHPRNFIAVGRNAKATVLESYVSTTDATYLVNAVTEVSLADGATLNHYRIQREGARAFHVGTTDAEQARDSHYFSFSFAIGGALTRTNIYTRLDGDGCGATLNGLYLLDGEQHCDHQTSIIHAQPNTYSRELYKGILDGQSHGVFNGKVYVEPVAQKTDGKQTNNTLLLSERAQIDTKPQLEIYADDVK